PIRDAQGHVVRWFGTNTDVTAQRAAEEALREADRRKDEFLAMLAHELRNPLASIYNAVQILSRLGPAEPKLQWAHDVIARQAKHLARLVDDLLDSARLIRGQITLKKEPVELATIVQQAVEAAQPLLEARQHHFRLILPHSPVWLEGDPARLVQVLLNLLDNAAKYTEPGGQIELEAECYGVEVAVRVRDTGPGLSPALLSRAFELFEQGERTLDRAQGGLGIGLTLVRRLVELHGGRVEAHSAGPEQGAEFTVWLPIRAMGTPSDTILTMAPEAARPAPNLRILLVDNDPDVLESLAMLLHLEGFDVKAATTGPAALDLARQFHPQVVLLDLGMPGMDGYEVARRLQERPPRQRPQRLIALTGYGDEETRRRVQEAGFTQHLVKPVELSVLVTLLRAES
ncbi:MAG TPA: ATP-binding protein, partial [Candidatus Competibacteraceae bacterium]|nr:ATP-binding protein [Candidatus Competibacteraceae bacterium]